MHHGYNLNCYKLVVAWLLLCHMEIWTVATGSPRAYGPRASCARASCVNCVHISHMALEAMLRLLLVASDPLKYHINTPASKLLLTFYGIWNLDFSRYIIPPFCASNKLTTIHILSLEYIIALYPLVLIAIVYICVELHDRDCRVLVCLWKPFHRCFAQVRRRWDPKASIIHTFATFLLFSYSKLLFVSASLMHSTRVYNSTIERFGPPVWYYDASMLYLRHEHLPFFCLAILVLVIFVAPPTLLLLLYPTKVSKSALAFAE